MPDLSISEAALAEMQKTLSANAGTLAAIDQAIREVDVAAVGADTFIRRLGDLHEALASSIWMLGEALSATVKYLNTANTTFTNVDRSLANGHTAVAQ